MQLGDVGRHAGFGVVNVDRLRDAVRSKAVRAADREIAGGRGGRRAERAQALLQQRGVVSQKDRQGGQKPEAGVDGALQRQDKASCRHGRC